MLTSRSVKTPSRHRPGVRRSSKTGTVGVVARRRVGLGCARALHPGAGIEAMLTEDRAQVLRTMPADRHASPGYLAANRHWRGITPEMAERAVWRLGPYEPRDPIPVFGIDSRRYPDVPGPWKSLRTPRQAYVTDRCCVTRTRRIGLNPYVSGISGRTEESKE
jgi:hypothetical protein